MTGLSATPERGDRRAALLVGLGLFCLACALYATTMALSFVPGDAANYLNSAHTGALTDRGNGVPLYITLLNAAVRFPSLLPLSDGARANWLSVLLGAAGLTVFFAAGYRATVRWAPALIASVTLMLTGLIWGSTTRIMPHVSLVLIGALFVLALVEYERRPSRSAALLMGLVCGVGFGLLPDAILLLPVAVARPLMQRRGDRWADLRSVALGAGTGILFNGLLIALHEAWSPVFATDGTTILQSTLFYLSGGQETGWVVGNLSVLHALQGCLRLPLEIGADFEFLGTTFAMLGFILGLRHLPRLHLSLLAAFVIISAWCGVYPGDTQIAHGLVAYPIAALWMTVGVDATLRRLETSWRQIRWPFPAHIGQIVVAALILVATVGSLGVAKLTYRDSLCRSGEWYLAGFCRERVPEGSGDIHLKRAEAAIDRIPTRALVFGASWDANDQMIYLMRVRGDRPDLVGPYDLTKLDVDQFLSLARPAWDQNQPVYLYGDWTDVENYSSELLPAIRAIREGPLVHELRPIEPSR